MYKGYRMYMHNTTHRPNEVTGHCSCLACQTAEQAAIEAATRKGAAMSTASAVRRARAQYGCTVAQARAIASGANPYAAIFGR